MEKCQQCHEFVFSNERHECKPVWKVWRDDDGAFEDADKIYADSAASAAEEWAEMDDYHSADYTIVGGEPATVCVQLAGLGADGKRPPVQRFVVSGESQAVYTAREAK